MYRFSYLGVIWLICLKFKTHTNNNAKFTFSLLQHIIKKHPKFKTIIVGIIRHTYDLHLHINSILFKKIIL